jgi:hypothetical protein
MSTDLARVLTRQRKPRRCYNFDMWHRTDSLACQIPETYLNGLLPNSFSYSKGATTDLRINGVLGRDTPSLRHSV